MAKVYVALVLIGLLCLVYARWIEPNWLHVHTVTIHIPGLDPSLDGFIILHLSDLHQCRFGSGQQRLLSAANSRHYDIVAFTGDILDNPAHYDITPAAELLAGLQAPVFFVFGNHDYHQIERLTRDLEQLGVTILANTWHVHHHNGAQLQIAGIHDPYWSRINYHSSYQADLDAALAGTEPGHFTVLLAHSPAALEQAAAAGIPLLLVGHTHGGQVKLPLLGAPFTASGKLFDQYVQGLYQLEETRIYINRGLGTTGLPIRFLSRPEVVFIQLKRA